MQKGVAAQLAENQKIKTWHLLRAKNINPMSFYILISKNITYV